MRRKPVEPVAVFIKRFNNIDNMMTLDCKPPVTAAKVRFSKAFDDDFVVMLRERKSETLADMQANAIEVEANKSTSSKLKAKEKKMKGKWKLERKVLHHQRIKMNTKLMK